MDTMNFWITGANDELKKTLAAVKGLVINDEEARQLTGESNLVLAADAIRRMGPGTVIVKRGEHGALLFDGDGVFAAPAFPLREVRDPTGAGDTFAGGLMGSLASHGSVTPDSLRRAMIHGSVLASFCVERFGLDRLRDLTRKDIDARFAEFKRLTSF
jgi:sugar/nucleoside kinase (ribokinase family)